MNSIVQAFPMTEIDTESEWTFLTVANKIMLKPQINKPPWCECGQEYVVEPVVGFEVNGAGTEAFSRARFTLTAAEIKELITALKVSVDRAADMAEAKMEEEE